MDSGTAREVGYAIGRGIPVLGVRSDFRALGDKGVNIMLSRSVDAWLRFPYSEDAAALAKRIAQKVRRLVAKSDGEQRTSSPR